MVSRTRLPAVIVAGVATLATMASAQVDSVANCTFSGASLSGSVSEIVGVNIAANVTAFLCNSPDVTDINATANITAMEIATATATAIANTTANCFAQGNAIFTINGVSLAIAEARAIAESVAEASLAGSACGQCEVAAGLFARSYSSEFIAATAASEVTIAGSTTGNESQTIRASNFVSEYVNATAIAYAEILATLRIGVDGDCNGTLLLDLGNELDGVECDVSVAAAGSEVVRNAASTAATNAVVLACNNADGAVAANITTEAIATAMAVAMAEISATCTIFGEARACTITEAEANATAKAVATAFASIYVNATNECEPTPCEVSAEVLTEALDFVLVSATTAALLEQCGGPDDIFNITLLQTQIVEQSARAVSALIFNVTVVGGECIADLDILAGIFKGDVMVNDTVEVVIPVLPPVIDIIVNDTIELPDDPVDGDVKDDPGEGQMPPPPPLLPLPPLPPLASLPPCGPQCAATNLQCGGRGFDAPVQCCDPEDVCVQLSTFLSQCRPLSDVGGRGLDRCNPEPLPLP